MKPHKVLSREVTKEDLERVKADAIVMAAITKVPQGIYSKAYAVAHSQVTDTDPLCFFVTKDDETICNPKIISQTKIKRPMLEGCMSFAEEQKKFVFRPYKITVEFQYITEEGSLSEPVTETYKGIEAEVFCHEIEHFKGIYIYDENYDK